MATSDPHVIEATCDAPATWRAARGVRLSGRFCGDRDGRPRPDAWAM